MSKLHTEKSELVQFENDSLNTEKQEAVQGGFYFGNSVRRRSSRTSQRTRTSRQTRTSRRTNKSFNSKLNTFIRCNFALATGRRW